MHLMITIDGKTVMNGELGPWTHKPSAELEALRLQAAKPTARQPWSMPLLGIITELAMNHAADENHHPAWTIDIITDNLGWTISTHQAPAKAPTCPT